MGANTVSHVCVCARVCVSCVSIIADIDILFWIHWHDQRACYVSKHINLSTLSVLTVLIMRYTSLWCVCHSTPSVQLYDSGVIVLQQLFQVILGLTVKVNTWIVN